MRKQGSCVEKEIKQGTMPGARRLGRPRTAWMDNIKTWTGLPVEESIRMTEINGESTSMVWPTLGSRTAEEQNRTEQKVALNPVTCLALLYSEFFNPINARFKGHWK